MLVPGPSNANKMELRQERKLSKDEFERVASELRQSVGSKMRNHKDGDAERLLFKKR
jgi:hypothetical protein